MEDVDDAAIPPGVDQQQLNVVERVAPASEYRDVPSDCWVWTDDAEELELRCPLCLSPAADAVVCDNESDDSRRERVRRSEASSSQESLTPPDREDRGRSRSVRRSRSRSRSRSPRGHVRRGRAVLLSPPPVVGDVVASERARLGLPVTPAGRTSVAGPAASRDLAAVQHPVAPARRFPGADGDADDDDDEAGEAGGGAPPAARVPCGHVFCSRCIRRHLRTCRERGDRQACPVCKRSLRADQLRIDMCRRRRVAGLRVRCGRHRAADGGCEWVGSFGLLGVEWRRHTRVACPLLATACPNAGCDQRPLVGEAARVHGATCPHAVVACPYAPYGCAFTVVRPRLRAHLEEDATATARHLSLVEAKLAQFESLAPQHVVLRLHSWSAVSLIRNHEVQQTLRYASFTWCVGCRVVDGLDEIEVSIACVPAPPGPLEIVWTAAAGPTRGSTGHSQLLQSPEVVTLSPSYPRHVSAHVRARSLSVDVANDTLSVGIAFELSDWIKRLPRAVEPRGPNPWGSSVSGDRRQPR